MFVVKGLLAPAVVIARRDRRRGRRSAAQVDDFDVGCEQDPAAAGADRGAEVDVFRVHEIALVKPADGLRVAPPHQQARAADPVGILPPAVSASTRPLRASRFWRSSFSGPIIRPNDSSARPLPSTSRGPTTATVASRSSSASSRSIAPAGTTVSLFNRRMLVAGAGADADVVGAGEPEVRARLDDGDRGQAARVRAAVGRSVVDDDNFVAGHGRCGAQRFEAPPRSRWALKDTMMIDSTGFIASRPSCRLVSNTAIVSRAARGQLYFASCAGAAARIRAARHRRTASTRARASSPADR